jgi:beta-N-acetylhexosaminidase
MRRTRFALSAAVVAISAVALTALVSTTATTTTTTTAAATTTTTAAAAAPTPQASNLACAAKVVTKWTLVALANQTVVVSVNARDLAAMAPAAQAGFAGLILFGTTAPAGMARVVAHLQTLTPDKYPMLIMTDEEGGGVERLTNVVGAFPWAQSMGKTMSAAQITATALRVGRALKSVGVNMDLAPVLDVDGRSVEPGEADPDGLRSFGGSPSLVATDGTAFMEGLSDANLTSVLKHFPGLGGASRNTDYGPATTKPWSVLKVTALVPFEKAIAAGAPAVMLSNASVPGLTTLPAGISPAVVRELRQNLGFKGLLVTDSLSAGAISALHLSAAQAAVKALAAGADLILAGSAGTPAAEVTFAKDISRSIVSAVVHGVLARSTLVAAVAQVLATRNTLTCPAAS